MRVIARTLLATGLAVAVVACGGDDGDENGEGKSQGPLKPLKEGEFTAGDTTGSFGTSLEVQIADDIKRYVAEGADPNKTYLIEHHLAASTLATAREIVAWAGENGFTPVFDESAVVSGEWIHVTLVKESKLEANSLWRDSNAITFLVQKIMCEYDGWGFRDRP